MNRREPLFSQQKKVSLGKKKGEGNAPEYSGGALSISYRWTVGVREEACHLGNSKNRRLNSVDGKGNKLGGGDGVRNSKPPGLSHPYK